MFLNFSIVAFLNGIIIIFLDEKAISGRISDEKLTLKKIRLFEVVNDKNLRRIFRNQGKDERVIKLAKILSKKILISIKLASIPIFGFKITNKGEVNSIKIIKWRERFYPRENGKLNPWIEETTEGNHWGKQLSPKFKSKR